MNRRTLLPLVMIGLSLAPAARGQVPADDDVEVVEVRKLWDYAPHNAFTTLVSRNGEWFCAFREGNAHVSPDGAIRVLRSIDLITWQSFARLTDPKADLRDPKLCVTPDNRLMLTATAATPKAAVRHRTKAWFSKDGRQWGEPAAIGDDNFWLWRVTWHEGAAYGVGYLTAVDRATRFTRLYKSGDGLKWQAIVDPLVTEDSPNESSLLFDADGAALCLVRRETGNKSALLGASKPPYTTWAWKDLGVRIGGPAMIRMKDGRLFAVVRLYDGTARTAVCSVSAEDGSLTELAELPSGGDTSYAGLVEDNGVLYVSYYSSHEKKAAIYLAKLVIWKGGRPDPPSPRFGF